jgi:hypothetical protein
MTKHRCGSRKPGAGVTAVGLLLILTGALLLLDNFGILWIDHVWDLWPLALISVGLAELLHWSRQSAS